MCPGSDLLTFFLISLKKVVISAMQDWLELLFVWLHLLFMTKKIPSVAPAFCNINTPHVLEKDISFVENNHSFSLNCLVSLFCSSVPLCLGSFFVHGCSIRFGFLPPIQVLQEAERPVLSGCAANLSHKVMV